ncbi:phospholipase D active site domain-containing protein [Toxoplasma gondii MAS]|uniref:Phospholipase D active site domain-containing protein n=1 Tax=Toxoplasma gondii MAS TaxID=943118 RepID=A0A086QKA4_TOXGO|nr:phospholipase D active site domain-containing protein [Toxoplasma gondii MAS]
MSAVVEQEKMVPPSSSGLPSRRCAAAVLSASLGSLATLAALKEDEEKRFSRPAFFSVASSLTSSFMEYGTNASIVGDSFCAARDSRRHSNGSLSPVSNGEGSRLEEKKTNRFFPLRGTNDADNTAPARPDGRGRQGGGATDVKGSVGEGHAGITSQRQERTICLLQVPVSSLPSEAVNENKQAGWKGHVREKHLRREVRKGAQWAQAHAEPGTLLSRFSPSRLHRNAVSLCASDSPSPGSSLSSSFCSLPCSSSATSGSLSKFSTKLSNSSSSGDASLDIPSHVRRAVSRLRLFQEQQRREERDGGAEPAAAGGTCGPGAETTQIDSEARTSREGERREQGAPGVARRGQSLQLSEADFSRLETQWLALMERVKHFGRLSSGNSVKIYHEGDKAFSSILRTLRNAEKTILMEFYIYDNSSIGRTIKDALCAAARRGCFVVLVVDWVGGFNMPTAWQEELVAAGVNMVIFNPPFPLSGGSADASPQSSLSYLAATAKHILAYGKDLCGTLVFSSPTRKPHDARGCYAEASSPFSLSSGESPSLSVGSQKDAGASLASALLEHQKEPRDSPNTKESSRSDSGAQAPGSLCAERVGPIPFRDHRKNLIVDGKVAFVGSLNVSEDAVGEKFGGRNHFYDLHVRLRGPAVKALESLFVETLDTSNARSLRDRLVAHLARVEREQDMQTLRFHSEFEGSERHAGDPEGLAKTRENRQSEQLSTRVSPDRAERSGAVADLQADTRESLATASSLHASCVDGSVLPDASPSSVSASSISSCVSLVSPLALIKFSWSNLQALLRALLPSIASRDRNAEVQETEEGRHLLLGWKAVRVCRPRVENEGVEEDDDADDATDVLVQVLESNVMRNQRSIQAVLKSAIYNATVSLYVTAAYFIPPGFLRRALQTALARDGVDVSLLLSGESDVWGDVYATTYVARKFLTKQRRHAFLSADWEVDPSFPQRVRTFFSSLLPARRQPTLDAYCSTPVDESGSGQSFGEDSAASSGVSSIAQSGPERQRREEGSVESQAGGERAERRRPKRWRSLREHAEPRGDASVYFLTSRHCHAKNIVVDHLWSTTGSFNFDRFSSRRNMEVLVAFLDPGIALKFENLYWRHVQSGEAEQMTVEQWSNQSLVKKVLCFFCYYITRFAGKNFFDGLSDQRRRAVLNRLLIASYLEDMPASDLSTSLLWGFQ